MYLWVKVFHIVFVVAWMASLMVYPRYKMHQAKSAAGEPLFDTMKEASARLRRIILTPSMLAVWILGITMLVMNTGLFASGVWIWVKLGLVLVMTALHGMFVGIGKKIDRGDAVSVKKLQLLNEVPFILLIVIVIMVVIKPF